MGLLVNGQWHDQWYNTEDNNGEFVREDAQFRNQIVPASQADDSDKFIAESGRYHLYVSLACPWAHRTLIFRKLKGLEPHIGLSVVSPDMLNQGWEFTDYDEVTGDSLYQHNFMHQLYTQADANYSGRVTVPVLWDKKHQTIVNNESAEIIRIFNSAFNDITGNSLDLAPTELLTDIDHWNNFVYDSINNGVYRAGFATSQAAYERAFDKLFAAFDELDQHLSKQRYLVSGQITAADWRLFTTLIRFDAVYFGHFKCNLRPLTSYSNLFAYIRELYQQPGIAETVNMDHIKRHYYFSHTSINPSQVIPKGPAIDFMQPHNRSEIASK